MSRLPLIVVLGCTGTGKSKLAIEIAKKFGGEIVSADSMQVYRGLNVITNKVSIEEQSQVRHHMLDVADPLYQFTVVDFRNQALQIVENLLSTNKLPIVVGGTNYYIESLLWKVLIDKPNDGYNFTARNELESKSNLELYNQLLQVDPETAHTLHPNSRRKIIRSLEVFEQSGKTLSALLKEQREQEGGSELGGPLRYPNSCILWLQCDKDVLNNRLDERVDHMLQHGLIEELLNFHERYNQERIQCNELPDYTKGIFQTIGFKEFHEYLILSEEDKNSDKGQKLFKEGVSNLKLVTRRYAKTQTKWVKNRILLSGRSPNVYGLNATDLSSWNESVRNKAYNIVKSYIEGEIPKNAEPLPVKNPVNDANVTYYCNDCDRFLSGTDQFNVHLNSAKHKKILKRIIKERVLNSRQNIEALPYQAV